MDEINHGSEVLVVLQTTRLVPQPHELLYLLEFVSFGWQSLARCIENNYPLIPNSLLQYVEQSQLG